MKTVKTLTAMKKSVLKDIQSHVISDPDANMYKWKNECLYLHVTLPFTDEKFKALNQSFNNKFLKLENIVKQMQTDLEKKD